METIFRTTRVECEVKKYKVGKYITNEVWKTNRFLESKSQTFILWL